MDHYQIVTPADLDKYADTRESQSVIPELVYLLVKQSISDGSICRIPYGDAVNQTGADGLIECESGFQEFIPKGKSYWEIGVGVDPQSKATNDFTKRSINSKTCLPEDQRINSTFVFVTPRCSWDEQKQTEWLKKKKDLNKWKDIRILDGIKLADWLREFPALGHQIHIKLGLSQAINGFTTPSELWDEIQARMRPDDPQLPPQVFIAGRDNACSALNELFQNGGRRLLLHAESPNDVSEFVSGYLASLDKETASLYGNRCLFIKDENVWRSFVETRRSHILVADPQLGLDDANANLQTLATRNGHSVVIPICGALLREDHEILKVISPSRSQLEVIFNEAGFSSVRGKELASVGGGRLSALKRDLLGLGSLPPYATWDTARALAQAGLIGKWNGKNEIDLDLLESLLGKKYGEWIEIVRPELSRADTPLIQHNEKWRMLARGEAWNALGSRLIDNDLDQFKKLALEVLGEKNPIFELPKEDRFAASAYNKQLKHSSYLREGIAETLALLGSRSEALISCTERKATSIANDTVRELLKNASWEDWAGLNSYLPLFAEAAPNEFLNSVESALLEIDESPFHQIFEQESSGGVGGTIYISGLLWALEALAWDSDYLLRVVSILGELSAIDPGGQWSNRPSNSLTDIFLPWHLQTCAPIEKRKAAIVNLLKEQPEIGWELLLTLLPHSHGVTSGCHRPTWRKIIPNNWKDTVSENDYWKQITIFTDLAIGLAKISIDKLRIFIERLPDLPNDAQNNILKHLKSEMILNISDSDRYSIWESLNDLVRKHKKYSDADWSLSSDVINKIQYTSKLLKPESLSLKYRYLFSNQDFDLYDDKGSYEEQEQRLDQIRQNAIQELINKEGLENTLKFAKDSSAPHQVGIALGNITDESMESRLLPDLINTEDDDLRVFISGFVWSRFRKLSWSWSDKLLSEEWDLQQKSALLRYLPFEMDTWERVTKNLNDNEGLYWENVNVNPWGRSEDFTAAIEQLIIYGRANAAVQCIHRTIGRDGDKFNNDLATKALLSAIELDNINIEFDSHATVEVIKTLQKDPLSNKDSLFKIEWNLLPILDRFSRGSPVTLENRIASDAKFFCELISLVFRSKNEENCYENATELQENVAKNAYKLLHNWKIPPGLNEDNSFNPGVFREWLAEVKEISKSTGHFDIALDQIGNILPHVPKDPGGLWINHVVAEALNSRDAKKMRSGFVVKLFNQRGTYGDTNGRGELELAKAYKRKADALDDNGYLRFATAIRELAEDYEQQSKREASRDPYGN